MFVGIVGAETDLPTARRKIAIDCPVWRQNLKLAKSQPSQTLSLLVSQDIRKTKGECVKRQLEAAQRLLPRSYSSPARDSRFEMISSWTFLPPDLAIV
jgi:hypothetical protein